VIRADEARPHCPKTATLLLDHNSLRRAVHPPYSLDLAPSDFWLFAYLKEVVQRSSFGEPDESHEVLSAIQDILRKIDHETLDAVFQEWIIRLQTYSDRNGEYVE
jgi:hypothetical protein